MNCKLTGEFFSVVRMLQEEQKMPRDYGTGQLLFHSELNFLDTVHKNTDANVSKLSAILDVTKGAVTQIARKLYDKGLIEYYMLNKNKKEKYFRLTPAGETARGGHEMYHKEANDKLCAYFCTLDDTEREVISDFLSKLQEFTPFCEFACSSAACHSSEESETIEL